MDPDRGVGTVTTRPRGHAWGRRVRVLGVVVAAVIVALRVASLAVEGPLRRTLERRVNASLRTTHGVKRVDDQLEVERKP